jgi:hypothetical protein
MQRSSILKEAGRGILTTMLWEGWSIGNPLFLSLKDGQSFMDKMITKMLISWLKGYNSCPVSTKFVSVNLNGSKLTPQSLKTS